jgi:hypothetical protein
MYNNITKFINPKYATLFLIVLGCILLALFMNSRSKEGYTNSQINSKLKTKLNISALNTKLNQTNTIKNINTNINKLSTDKLGTESKVFTDLQNEVSMNNSISTANSRDMGTLYKRTSDLTKSKMDISSSVISDLQAGIKTKLDSSVFDSTMKNVPMGSTISDMIDGKISSRAGDINAAMGKFDANVADKTTAFDTNAANQTANFNGNVLAQTSSFNSNADTQRNAFNGLFDNKYGTFDSYAKSTTSTLGLMKDASVSAAERAEAALNQSIQIQNNIFGASSEKMITQANQYNTSDANNSTLTQKTTDLSMNNVSMSDLSMNVVRESLVNQDDLLQKETAVKNAITAYKTAAENYNSNTTSANLSELTEKVGVLVTATNELKAAYNSGESSNDQSAAIKEKASAIDNLRRELDNKMQRVLNKDDITNQYDSTVYTGIMWSILGTSLLYYIFTEM